MQTSKELAHRFYPYAALETERIERGHDQTRYPMTADLGFPQPRFGMAVPAYHGLLKTMHTALGKPRLLGNVAHALRARFTKKVENPKTFLPKSHVGRSSDGWLNSGWNSV